MLSQKHAGRLYSMPIKCYVLMNFVNISYAVNNMNVLHL